MASLRGLALLAWISTEALYTLLSRVSRVPWFATVSSITHGAPISRWSGGPLSLAVLALLPLFTLWSRRSEGSHDAFVSVVTSQSRLSLGPHPSWSTRWSQAAPGPFRAWGARGSGVSRDAHLTQLSLVALGTLGSHPALLALLPWFSFRTPDASDARGAGGPVLALQSLLALLATFTVRPGVTPVPLQPIRPCRTTVTLEAWLSPLPNEALLPRDAQRPKVTLHASFPRKARFSHCTWWSLGSHLSRRANWPLGSLRARFSWEALGTWGTGRTREARKASCAQVPSLASHALLPGLAQSALWSWWALQALRPLLPSWSVWSSGSPASLCSPHARWASRSWRTRRSRLSWVSHHTWGSRMAHRPLGSGRAWGSDHAPVTLFSHDSWLPDQTNESQKSLLAHRPRPSSIAWLALQAIWARSSRKPLPARLTLQARNPWWPHGSLISLGPQLPTGSWQASSSRLTLHAFWAVVPGGANVSRESLRSGGPRKPNGSFVSNFAHRPWLPPCAGEPWQALAPLVSLESGIS